MPKDAAKINLKPAPAPLTSDERRAKGKAVRARVPRVAPAGWKPPKNRRDAVDIVLESNADRIEQLIPVRMGRIGARRGASRALVKIPAAQVILPASARNRAS